MAVQVTPGSKTVRIYLLLRFYGLLLDCPAGPHAYCFRLDHTWMGGIMSPEAHANIRFPRPPNMPMAVRKGVPAGDPNKVVSPASPSVESCLADRVKARKLQGRCRTTHSHTYVPLTGEWMRWPPNSIVHQTLLSDNASHTCTRSSYPRPRH